MAGVFFAANTTAEVALAASSAKTLIRLISSTNSVIKIKEWGCFFDATASAEPVIVQLCAVNTSFGEYTAHTPTRRYGPAISARTVCQTNNTSSEPDILGVLATREIHPQSGYQEKFTYGEEIMLANGSTALNGIVALIVTSPSSVNALGEIIFEE